jgi:hypothetical protein
MKRPHRVEADGRVKVGCKEGTMSRRAQDWLAEQEVALLEAIYELQSPPESEDRGQPIRLETQKVRAVRSRPPSDPSQPNRAITE